jgi:membrane-bound lytic murein transglycosylase D
MLSLKSVRYPLIILTSVFLLEISKDITCSNFFLIQSARGETPSEPGPHSYHPEIAAALANPALQAKIRFWKDIYSKYDSKTGVIHDAKYIDKVYDVVDLRSHAGGSSQIIKKEKEKWRKVLLALHARQKQGLPPEGPDQEKVFALFSDITDSHRFLDATHRKRLRWQTGQRDHFLAGLLRSGRWLPMMEDEFRKAGVPVEITRLPFVESSFNLKARSKVGASGIWQFMRSTGKSYLRINSWVDERNDPVHATRAAARLLLQNYESLESWPLAVTAYNHGRQGMMRAVRSIGSRLIEDVLGQYKSRTFGFASGNFLSCLLAAIEVEREAEIHFGKLERDLPVHSFEFPLPKAVSFGDLVQAYALSKDTLLDLNPSLDADVIRGGLFVPAGYPLRLPIDPKEPTISAFATAEANWAKIPSKRTRNTPRY